MHYATDCTNITVRAAVAAVKLKWNNSTSHQQMKSFPFCMRLKFDTVFIIVEISKRWIRKTTAEHILHSPFSQVKNDEKYTHNHLKCSSFFLLTHTHAQANKSTRTGIYS